MENQIQALTEIEKAYYKEKVGGSDGFSMEPSSSGSASGSSMRGHGRREIRSSQGLLLSDIERSKQEQAMKIAGMRKRIKKMLEHYPITSGMNHNLNPKFT